MKKLFTYGLFSLLVCALGFTPAFGQTVQGVITGTVFDATGAVVPNANVTITNEGTGISETRTTGTDGSYRFPLVPLGTYTVKVAAPNFSESITRGILVEASKTVPLNVTLQLGKSSVTVEVTTQGPLVQTASSDLASTVDRSTIENIPLLSRNVYDLTFMAPQVSQGMDFQPATGGTRESGTQYMLNGSDNNDNFSEGFANVTPPLESVSEFTMLTNSMSAQYGRAAGAVVSASQKSGTNRFHGAAYEFNRNKSLNASDFFANRTGSPKEAYVRNNFGGEVDGPIVKNKTFFSAAYDSVILHFAPAGNPTAVPTASELAAIQAGAGPLAKFYLGKYTPFTSSVPCPNEDPSAIGHIGCVFLVDPVTDPIQSYFGRVDQNFSSKDRLSVTFNMSREAYTDKYGGGHPTAIAVNGVTHNHFSNVSLVETHTFGSNVYNELTIAQNRHYNVFAEGGGKFNDPEIYIDGANYGNTAIGFGPYEGGLIQSFVQDRWQLQDNLGWVHGRHSVKFGGSWQHGILYRNWDLGVPGFYEFANTLGPTAASDGVVNPDGSIGSSANPVNYNDSNFQNDFPYFEEVSIDPHTGARANNYRHYSMDDNNLFVQDDWKVRPNLTLNLGLRWERYGAPTEQHNQLAQFTNFNCLHSTTISFTNCIANVVSGPVKSMWNTRNKDFGPRVGFAWDVFGNGRTALRGGYGISYDRIFDNVWGNGAWNPPFYALLDSDATGGDSIFYSNPPKPSPSYVPDSIPGPGGRVSVRTMENNLKDSSAQNIFLGVEHQFGQTYLLRVNWQASLGRHLAVLMNWNRYDGMCLNATLSCRRPNSKYTGFNYRSNNVSSNYNAMDVELQKRVSKGLQFQASFTWSHLLDIGSDLFTGSTSQGGYSQPYYYISNAHQNLEYGSGAFDHRYALKLGYSYEIPVMRDQRGFAGKVVGGWQLTGFWQGYSGHPINVDLGRIRYAARDAGGARVLDANGNAINIAGDYNLDFTNNDHPVFIGTGNVYSNGSPADGIFTDNNKIGCGQAGLPATVANIGTCNAAFGVKTPNTLFVNPAGTGIRYGTLGRNVFHGPWFNGFDAALFKNFKTTENTKLQIRIEAFNFPNHPNFDFIPSSLSSSQFGKAQGLAGIPSRRLQLGARFLF